MPLSRILFFIVLSCTLISCMAMAAPVQKPEVALDLPEGWVEIPKSVLDDYVSNVRKMSNTLQNVNYKYGFQADAKDPWLSYPYIVVVVNEKGRIPEKELKAMPKVDFSEKVDKLKSDLSSIMSNTAIGKPQYDEATGIIWIVIQADVNEVGPIQGISGLIPTEVGFVQVSAYATKATYPKLLPTFREIITGAKLPPDMAYKRGLFANIPLLNRIDPAAVAQSALIGGLAGIAVAVVFALKRRRKAD